MSDEAVERRSDPTLVAVTLARIEGKLDRLGDRVTDMATDLADHEQRVRKLETKSVVTPMALATTLTVLAAVGGTVAAFLGLN